MKPFGHVLSRIAVLSAFVLPAATAQGRHDNLTMISTVVPPTSAVTLLLMPEVARELGLTSQQTRDVAEVKRHLDAEFKVPFEAAQSEKGSEGFRKFEKLVVEYWRIAEVRPLVVLSEPQRIRLRALQYQSLGFRALLLEDLAAKLALRPEQTKSLAQMSIEATEKRSRCAKMNMHLRTEENTTLELDRIEAECERQALSVLDPAQAKAYLRLLGRRLDSVAGSSPHVTIIAK